MLAKNAIRVISVFLFALLLVLPLSGCGGGASGASSSSSQAAAGKTGDFELKTVRFHDIAIKVPDTLVDDSSGSSDQLSLSFPESAKDPFAFNIHILVSEGVDFTARDAYEGVAGFDAGAELVEANGLEFFVQREPEYDSSTIMLTLDGACYSIFVDSKEGLGQAYEKYAKDICEHISLADASRPNSSASGSAPQSGAAAIPAGAIDWKQAQSHVGESITVCGPVANANYAQAVNGRPTYLDLGVAYPDRGGISVIIWGQDRGKFSDAPEIAYQGKTVCVTGEPYMYDGRCYIKVTSPSQIQIA